MDYLFWKNQRRSGQPADDDSLFRRVLDVVFSFSLPGNPSSPKIARETHSRVRFVITSGNAIISQGVFRVSNEIFAKPNGTELAATDGRSIKNLKDSAVERGTALSSLSREREKSARATAVNCRLFRDWYRWRRGEKSVISVAGKSDRV